MGYLRRQCRSITPFEIGQSESLATLMKNEPCVLVLNTSEKPRKCPRQKGWMECPYSVLVFWSSPGPHRLAVSWTSWVGKGWWGWVFTGGFCSQANIFPSLTIWFGSKLLGSVKREERKERGGLWIRPSWGGQGNEINLLSIAEKWQNRNLTELV